MKRVYFLRHGDAEQHAQHDKFRKLSVQGVREVEYVAEFFLTHPWTKPEYVLSSSAVRTKETCELFLNNTNSSVEEVQWSDDLYLANEHKIIAAIEKLPDENDTVLFVGHNPGIEQAVSTLIENYVSMGTSYLVAVDFDISSWGEVACASPVNVTTITPAI